MVNDELSQAREDLADAKEMAYEDHDFQEEADRLEKSVESLEEKLADLLAPRDEQDSEDIIMEIKAGAGGEEAALFAGDLARMYQKYAEGQGWRVDLSSASAAAAWAALIAAPRALTPEVLVSGDHFAVVRPRPSFDEMIGRDTIPDWID